MDKLKFKHTMVWEEHNGPVPKGNKIIFGDRNKENIEIDNLICVSQEQLAILNVNRLIQPDADLTRMALAVVNVKIKSAERRNRK